MAGHRRERFYFVVVVLVAIAAIIVIAYKAESLGWTSDTARYVAIQVDLAG